MSNDKNKISSIVTSIALHLTVFILLFALRYNSVVASKDFVAVEISSTEMPAIGSEGGGGGGGGGPLENSELRQGNSPELNNPQNETKTLSSKDDQVNVKEKVTPKTEIKSTGSKVGTSTNKTEGSGKGTGTGKGTGIGSGEGTGVGSGKGSGAGSGEGSGIGPGKGSGIGDGYSIFGLGTRRIYNHPLPSYPDGLSENADIKLKFEILSNGTVGRVLVIKRGKPQFENAAINSLKRWKFQEEPTIPVQEVSIVFPFRFIK